MSSLDTASAKQLTTLIRFNWGENHHTYAAYAIGHDDITVSGAVHTASPGIEVKLDAFHGGTKDSGAVISMLSTIRPADTLGRPFAHSPVRVRVSELDPSWPDTLRNLFIGDVVRVSVGRGGRSGIVQIEACSPKKALEIPLGIMVGSTCPWQFGDKNCCYPIVYMHTAIEAVVGDTVEVVNNLLITDEAYFRRGFVIVDGCKVGVRKCEKNEAGNFLLALYKLPPPEWITGTLIACVPGCDKTIEMCRERWNWEEYFGGIGLKMPAYNPSFEPQ